MPISMKGWKIRQALPSDAGQLQRCMESAFSGYLERFNGARLPPMDVNYQAEIENYPVWVAEQDDCICGGLIMVFEAEYASLANIGIHAAYQGQGLGKQLMAFAEKTARDKGYSVLNLTTHVSLHENLSLYEYLGWKETGRDDVRVYMSKDIKSS